MNAGAARLAFLDANAVPSAVLALMNAYSVPSTDLKARAATAAIGAAGLPSVPVFVGTAMHLSGHVNRLARCKNTHG